MVGSRSRMGKSSLDGTECTRIDFDSTCEPITKLDELVKICDGSIVLSSRHMIACRVPGTWTLCAHVDVLYDPTVMSLALLLANSYLNLQHTSSTPPKSGRRSEGPSCDSTRERFASRLLASPSAVLVWDKQLSSDLL